jgi:uncharacterized protein (DUF4415 family)
MSSSIRGAVKKSALSQPEKEAAATVEDIKTASLEDIIAMRHRGELYHNPDALEGEPLGPEFWANAKVVYPPRSRSVHLKLDPEVFEYFVQITKGKGHLTRMQAVLKAYMTAHKATQTPDGETR